MLNTSKKLYQRERLIKALGLQQGLTYEKHRNKIQRSLGYMRDGNVTHYVACGFRLKTRDRNRYGKIYLPSHSDAKKLLDAHEYSID